MLGGENSILENQMQSNGGSFNIRLHLLYCAWCYYCVAGSGELDAGEVNTVGTLQYFFDLFLKTKYYY